MMLTQGAGGAPPSGKWWEPIRDASTASLVFDLSDFSSLFQDTAATTPVTAAGQTVKAIANQGTGGGFATSSTGAVLTYDAVNDRHYFVPPATNGFKMTGVDSALLGRKPRSAIAVGEVPGNTANYEFLFQLGVDADGNYQRLVMCNEQAQGKFAMFSGGPSGGVLASAYVSGLDVYSGTHELGTPNDTMTIYKGGTLLNTATNVPQSSVTTGQIVLGDYTTTGAAPISKFYALVIVDRVITSGERAAAVAGAL